MADPVTLAALSMGAIGGGISAFGSLQQGESQANLYKYQAGVANTNKTLALQDADYARATGEVEAQQSGMRTAAEVGSTKAAFGASGVTGGSQDKVISSEIAIGQENEGILRANAAKRAFGFDVEAAKDTSQASVYDAAATNSLRASKLAALGTLIGTAGNVSSKWLQYKQSFDKPDAGGDGMFGGDGNS